MTAQLTFDALPAWRTRDGIWPVAAHQRGSVRMPWTSSPGFAEGDIVPAWVCCQCGGVEVGEFALHLNHGCCTKGAGCVSIWLTANHRAFGNWTEPCRPFDAHWLPAPPP